MGIGGLALKLGEVDMAMSVLRIFWLGENGVVCALLLSLSLILEKSFLYGCQFTHL